MLTGFNTDIEHAGVTYHVQTEDKGLETPLILTLVYSGGAILASKRSPYDDLIASGFSEPALIERVNRQHKLICAAVLAGRLSDLKKMTEREAATRQQARDDRKADISETGELTPIPLEMAESVPESAGPHDTEEPLSLSDGPPPAVVPIEIVEAEVLAPPGESVGFALSEAYEVVAEFARAEEIERSQIRLKLIDTEELRGGQRTAIRIMVLRGIEGNDVIVGAEVSVKVLGSSFKPLLFQSKTGPNGIATVRMQIPHFNTGRAAILARSQAEGHEAELRQVIRQG
ncbi:MAG: hypothetical protein ABIP75_19845 [Pyrinomonadaceae bacterium]